MKEQFNTIAFKPVSLGLIEAANGIIGEYTAMGYDLSVRQLFYQFVSRNLLRNSQRNYENLAALVSDARLAGLIDWDCIKDRNRQTQTRPTFVNIQTFLQGVANQYLAPVWDAQSYYIEVMCEKQALEGVLIPLSERWRVPFTANKGYSSSSSLYERGKIIQSMRDVEGKRPVVIYVSDHDPSGVDMVRDVRERLELFSDGPVTVVNPALSIEQVRKYNLPPNPAKLDDSRAAEYIERFGAASWELDALNPTVLAEVVEQAIKRCIDMTAWDKSLAAEDEEQTRLQDIIDKLKPKA